MTALKTLKRNGRDVIPTLGCQIHQVHDPLTSPLVKLVGIFASEEDARSPDADNLAIAIEDAANLDAETLAIADANSDALSD